MPEGLCFNVVHPAVCVCACMCPYVHDVVSAISMVYVDVFSPNFCHWCVLGQMNRIRFWGQKVKGQGHSMTICAKNTVGVGIQRLTPCINF